jgi:hypothetical protein
MGRPRGKPTRVIRIYETDRDWLNETKEALGLTQARTLRLLRAEDERAPAEG